MELHDTSKGLKLLGDIAIDHITISCRSNNTQYPKFNGCPATDEDVTTKCALRDYAFWTGFAGLVGYDADMKFILTDNTFKHCTNEWPDLLPGNEQKAAIFEIATFSELFVPGLQMITKNTQFGPGINPDQIWFFSLWDEIAVAGRLSGFLDLDGTTATTSAGTGSRTIIGSAFAKDWWTVHDADCYDSSETQHSIICEVPAEVSVGSFTIWTDDFYPSTLNMEEPVYCLSLPSNIPCPTIGYATHFTDGNLLSNTALEVTPNTVITGPVDNRAGVQDGWYLQFLDGAPIDININRIQLEDPMTNLIVALPYPAGTLFTIRWIAAEGCRGFSIYLCEMYFTLATSLSELYETPGLNTQPKYFWDSSINVVYFQVISHGGIYNLGDSPVGVRDGPGWGAWQRDRENHLDFKRNGVTFPSEMLAGAPLNDYNSKRIHLHATCPADTINANGAYCDLPAGVMDRAQTASKGCPSQSDVVNKNSIELCKPNGSHQPECFYVIPAEIPMALVPVPSASSFESAFFSITAKVWISSLKTDGWFPILARNPYLPMPALVVRGITEPYFSLVVGSDPFDHLISYHPMPMHKWIFVTAVIECTGSASNNPTMKLYIKKGPTDAWIIETWPMTAILVPDPTDGFETFQGNADTGKVFLHQVQFHPHALTSTQAEMLYNKSVDSSLSSLTDNSYAICGEDSSDSTVPHCTGTFDLKAEAGTVLAHPQPKSNEWTSTYYSFSMFVQVKTIDANGWHGVFSRVHQNPDVFVRGDGNGTPRVSVLVSNPTGTSTAILNSTVTIPLHTWVFVAIAVNNSYPSLWYPHLKLYIKKSPTDQTSLESIDLPFDPLVDPPAASVIKTLSSGGSSSDIYMERLTFYPGTLTPTQVEDAYTAKWTKLADQSPNPNYEICPEVSGNIPDCFGAIDCRNYARTTFASSPPSNSEWGSKYFSISTLLWIHEIDQYWNPLFRRLPHYPALVLRGQDPDPMLSVVMGDSSLIEMQEMQSYQVLPRHTWLFVTMVVEPAIDKGLQHPILKLYIKTNSEQPATVQTWNMTFPARIDPDPASSNLEIIGISSEAYLEHLTFYPLPLAADQVETAYDAVRAGI